MHELRSSSVRSTLLLAWICATCSAVIEKSTAHAAGADPHAHHKQHAGDAQREQRADIKVHDVAVLDQDNHARRFKSEVIGAKLAVVNFVYTTCTAVCPAQSASFTKLQDLLGARLGREVVLVSVSVDPITDIPARLQAYAQSRGARAGWRWVTGAKRDIDLLLSGFGAYTPDYRQHPAMVLVGDATNGKWSRYVGFPRPEQLAQRLAQLQSERQRARE